MTEPTLRDCINYMKQQLKGMEKYPKSYEFNIPYYRKTIEFLEEGRPHGEWVESKERKGHFYCSECVHQDASGKWRELFDFKYNFCPNCGADMRKEGEAE